jgi:DNA-binding MarR family transcriptional regulator
MKSEDPIETMSHFVDAVISVRQAIKYYVQQKIKETHSEITYEMFQVLMVLWKKGEINQQEIANTVQKGKASLTPLIDNLTRVNLVTRTEDSADRRNKIISLTKEGKLYQKKFEPMLNEFYTTLNSGVPAEKIKEITGLLLKMSDQLEK